MLKDIYRFIVRQFRIDSFGDVCLLIPRLVIAVLILGELYGDFLYLKCLAKTSEPPYKIELLLALGKRVILILVFCLIYYGVRYVHKKGIWPRAIISLLLLQFVISFVAAGYGAWRYKGPLRTGLFGIFYWNGPYHGRVTDEDTGEPVAGVAVSAQWEFSNLLFITGVDSYADARETVTNANGNFLLPPARKFWLWPFTTIGLLKFRVFKPGYKRVAEECPENIFRAVSVKLKKVRTREERPEVLKRITDNMYEISYCERYKVLKTIKMIQIEDEFVWGKKSKLYDAFE